MKSKQISTSIIYADDGNYLTQVNDVPIYERVVSDRIAIGKNDFADNYKEITKEEGDKYLAEKAEYGKRKYEELKDLNNISNHGNIKVKI